MSEPGIGKSFGESIAFTGAENCPISIISATDSTVIFIAVKKILESCSPPYRLHMQLTENIIKLLAEKNMTLQMKNDILSIKIHAINIIISARFLGDDCKAYCFSLYAFKMLLENSKIAAVAYEDGTVSPFDDVTVYYSEQQKNEYSDTYYDRDYYRCKLRFREKIFKMD